MCSSYPKDVYESKLLQCDLIWILGLFRENQVQMRLSVCGVLILKENICIWRKTNKADEGRDAERSVKGGWSEVHSNQRPPNLKANTQKLGVIKGRFSCRCQREHCSANTFRISMHQSFVILATPLMVAYYCRLKNLIEYLYTKCIQRMLEYDSPSTSQDFASKLPKVNYHP